jgi:hypothetical protein
MMKESKMSLSQKVLGAFDLAIEFATLGEYGLEQIDLPALDADTGLCRRERSGRTRRMPSRAAVEAPAVAREARTTTRRRGCETPLFSSSCLADAPAARR